MSAHQIYLDNTYELMRDELIDKFNKHKNLTYEGDILSIMDGCDIIKLGWCPIHVDITAWRRKQFGIYCYCEDDNGFPIAASSDFNKEFHFYDQLYIVNKFCINHPKKDGYLTLHEISLEMEKAPIDKVLKKYPYAEKWRYILSFYATPFQPGKNWEELESYRESINGKG